MRFARISVARAGRPGESPRTGDIISGIAEAQAVPGVTVRSAGVGAGPGGSLVTAGGRVLNLVGEGPDTATARSRAYEALDRISWPGMHARTDIASTHTDTSAKRA